MINFLRFEGATGEGVYMLECGEVFDFYHHNMHPTFNVDSKLKQNFIDRYGSENHTGFKFGFADYKQILEWIPKKHLKQTFANMKQNGIQCTGYEGEVLEGGSQSLIKRKTSRRGRKIGFKTLLKRIEETY